MTSDYIQKEVMLMNYYRMRVASLTGEDLGRAEAAKQFTEQYAKRYEEVYSEGISQEDLRIKLFYPGRDR